MGVYIAVSRVVASLARYMHYDAELLRRFSSPATANGMLFFGSLKATFSSHKTVFPSFHGTGIVALAGIATDRSAKQ